MIMADMVKLKTEMPTSVEIESAISHVDDIVSKQYLTRLTELEVEKFPEELSSLGTNVRMFEVGQLVYDVDEFMIDKFTTIYNTLADNSGLNIFVYIDKWTSNKVKIFLGVRSDVTDKGVPGFNNALRQSLIGQFPGTNIGDNLTKNEIEDKMRIISNHASTIASVSIVPSKRSENNVNSEFIQSIDKLLNGMRSEKFQVLLLASSVNSSEIRMIRNGYETMYTSLSPYLQSQFTKGTNETKTQGITNSVTKGETLTSSNSMTDSMSSSITESENYSNTEGTSQNKAGSIVKGGALVAGAGLAAVSTVVTAGAAAGPIAAGLAASGVSASSILSSTAIVGGLAAGLTKSKNKSKTVGNSNSQSNSTSHSQGTSNARSLNESSSSGKNESIAEGINEGVTRTVKNRWIAGILDQIDRQLERVKDFESSNMWLTSAYFISKDADVAEPAARTFKALMQGENSGVEATAVNTWIKSDKNDEKFEQIQNYLMNFRHPVFNYGGVPVMATSMLSGNELGMFMGLPQESVPGFPVQAQVTFGVDVNRRGLKKDNQAELKLGYISNMGKISDLPVILDLDSLSGHTFVTGSTGAGKSTTIYAILHKLMAKNKHFMVIEPAKGEYKYEFGGLSSVHVFGTNTKHTELLRINPFYFDSEIHVLEHVDRLIEIFNVAWTMYDAMPAMLKKAVLKSYTDAGWNLNTSENQYDVPLYPTIKDLVNNLKMVINESGYSAEVKGNYEGALVTRVESLANGLTGQIFGGHQLTDEMLFDQNVIVDLSRVGSAETKSLLMGVLILRLNEYRMANEVGKNKSLGHVTILEEAHNILRRSQPGSNELASKSVEMISNSIAEMRTYGEGFIIVDQSPEAVDLAAIRNTNTKIIMRLPDLADRKAVGFAAALNEKQVTELSKLPKGVAVVYQNDWLEPVLTKIERYDDGATREEFQMIDTSNDKVLQADLRWFISSLESLSKKELVDFEQLQQYARNFKLTVKSNIMIDSWRNNQPEKISIVDIASIVNDLVDINLSEVNINQSEQIVSQFIDNQQLEIADDLKLFMSEMVALGIARNVGDVNIFKNWRQLRHG